MVRSAWRRTRGAQGEPAAPIVTDEIHRSADLLKLADQPLDVRLLRGGEARRMRAAESGKRERDRVGSTKLSAKVVSKGDGLGDSVNEDDGHASSSLPAGELVQAGTVNSVMFDVLPVSSTTRSADLDFSFSISPSRCAKAPEGIIASTAAQGWSVTSDGLVAHRGAVGATQRELSFTYEENLITMEAMISPVTRPNVGSIRASIHEVIAAGSLDHLGVDA